MHRLFVAFRPPPEIRRHLLALSGPLPGARWQEDAQLHCTLRFIGEVDRHQAEDVAAALGGVSHPPLSLRLEGLGSFDKAGRVDTLWAGLAPRDAVATLHDRIDRALQRVGLAPDGRAYRPHITLARFPRSAGHGPGIEALVTPPDPLPFRVASFELYESSLGSEGAAYDAVVRYPLEGPDGS
jgi:RNA 2',3'-cyclic 3'-phosphodiesterase